MLYQTRLASPQGTLLPLTPQGCLVVYRATHTGRRTRHPAHAQQLLLFELVMIGLGTMGFPEESEKFFTLGEIAVINQCLWPSSKNVGILLANPEEPEISPRLQLL
jgi:hypothetical protein